jgi:phytoene dehydrogenase-like protein
LDFIKNDISIGYKDQIISLTNETSIEDFKKLLFHTFPTQKKDITTILIAIQKIMTYSDVLYGVDNPLFIDFKENPSALKTMFPWFRKYMTTIGKIEKLKTPVYEYLQSFTSHLPLIDLIAQHFFTNSSAFFALSYFQMYLDYYYPVGGTQKIIEVLENSLLEKKCQIKKNTPINQIHPKQKILYDNHGNSYTYDKLIWAADLDFFYRSLYLEDITSKHLYKKINAKREKILTSSGNQSIFTLFLALDTPTSTITHRTGAHCFYTPSTTGLSSLMPLDLSTQPKKEKVLTWVTSFLTLTTYEISCPAARDRTLAPEHQTGLVISSVFDFNITKYAKEMGFYKELKEEFEKTVISTLDITLFPDISKHILFTKTASPLTMQTQFHNKDGAITGWSFKKPAPVVEKFVKITNSVKTPFKDIYQAGHWTFSPSGLPTAIITGKIAADKAK